MSGELWIFLFNIVSPPVFVATGAVIVFVLFLIFISAFRDLFNQGDQT